MPNYFTISSRYITKQNPPTSMHPSTCLGKHRNSRGNKSYCFPRDKYIDYAMTLEDNQVVLWLKAMRELHMKDYFSFYHCFLTACLVFQDSDRGIQLTLLVCSQSLALDRFSLLETMLEEYGPSVFFYRPRHDRTTLSGSGHDLPVRPSRLVKEKRARESVA